MKKKRRDVLLMSSIDIAESINDFEKQIGYVFKDKSLIANALTHSSYANENGIMKKYCNERLEFLGDALVDLIAGEYLYIYLPDCQEGILSKKRAAVVCEQSFAKIAKKITLGEHILLGRGEESSGGRTRASVLADAFEAVIAAIYLDSDFDNAKKWVLSQLQAALSDVSSGDNDGDFKSALQETVQKGNKGKVTYELIGEQGPEHAKVFNVCVMIDGKRIAAGKGTSKKDAEQAAAGEALKIIKKD